MWKNIGVKHPHKNINDKAPQSPPPKHLRMMKENYYLGGSQLIDRDRYPEIKALLMI
jgi:hypothetical protein